MPAADQGVNPDRYSVIPRTLIFIRRGDSLLLIKGAPGKTIWPGMYNGIGGHIEKGEDPQSAARRELEEETGISNADLRLVGVITIDTGQPAGISLYVFSGESPQKSLRSSPEGDLSWVKLRELDSLPLVEDLRVLLPRVLSHTRGDPPFSAQYRYDLNDQLVIDFAP